MKILTGILITVSFQISLAQNRSIIPEPVSSTAFPGYYTFSPTSYFQANDFKSYTDAYAAKDLFIDYYNLPIKTATKQIGELSGIILQYDSTLQLPDGGYILKISQNAISITGKNKGGVFYGLMSLLQLIENPSAKTYQVPCMEIIDYPRFGYRGMHLDCSRHFFSVDFVKKYIDYLALYKLNTFHWHLTDDQGWRIEIKQYPKLTEVGAWRNGSMVGHYRDQKYDDIRYGGFYTQAEIKLIVKYAAARNITIIPEIEMPGHCVAALAAYPEYGCIDTNLSVAKGWGGFPDIFCPKEETFTFLENILTEVMALFPSEYIHIGGDEVEKTRWENSAFCQKLIVDSNLVNENGLQSYFIRRIERFVNSKGKKIIGWDEILEGGIAPNATIMSWRSEDGGITAAQQKHFAIMTPGDHCYFDHYQSDPTTEPVAIGGYTPLFDVYNYEPIPSVLTTEQQKYILGAQANLWTEYISTPEQVEYMLMPRLLALSEVLWSPKENKNYDEFLKRLLIHFDLLSKINCNYSKSIYKVEYKTSMRDDGALLLILSSNISLGKTMLRKYLPEDYTFDLMEYTAPIVVNNISPKFEAYLELPSGEAPLTKIELFISKATSTKITLAVQPSKKYSADGPFTLVNGIKANTTNGWSAKDWLGFSGKNLEATIDLDNKDSISMVTAGFLTDKLSWIYPPKTLEVLISEDGKKFKSVGKIDFDTNNSMRTENTIYFKKSATRYVRVIAENFGKIPEGNPGAGSLPWLFVDEISIE